MRNFNKAKKNKVGKYYLNNGDDIIFKTNELDTDTNSIVEDSDYIKNAKRKLDYLCIDRFKNNMDVYKKNRSSRRLKFFFTYEVPLIAIAVSSGFVLNISKKSEVVPTYNLECTMISDGKMIQDVEDNQYFITSINTEVDSSKYEKISKANTTIQYQVKNGTKNVIVNLEVDSKGELSYKDSLTGNFYDLNADAFKNVEVTEIDAKYQEIINDIDEFIMNNSNISSSTKNKIKEMTKEDKTVIITTILEYAQTGEISIIESADSLLARKVGWGVGIYFCILLYFCVAMGIGGYKNKVLRSNGSELEESYGEKTIIPFITERDCKEAFVQVDKTRLREIKEIASEYLDSHSSEKLREVIDGKKKKILSSHDLDN